MNSLKNKLCIVRRFTKDQDLDFLFLVETWAKSNDEYVNAIPGYHGIARTRSFTKTSFQKGHGGILVYMKDKWRKSANCLKSESKNILWLSINTRSEKILFGAVYYSPENSGTPDSKEHLLDTLFDEKLQHSYDTGATKVLICGDFNARTGHEQEQTISITIGRETFIEPGYLPDRTSKDTVVNTRGKSLLEFCSTSEMCILNGRSGNDQNQGQYTCVNVRGASVVDYVLIDTDSYDQIMDFEVGAEHASDHFPLLFSLRGPSVLNNSSEWNDGTSPMTQSIKWDAAKCQDYREALQADPVLQGVITSADAGDIGTAVSNLNEAVKRAATTAGMKLKKCQPLRNRNYNTWFDNECMTAKLKMNRYLRIFRKQRTENTLDQYIMNKRSYRCLLNKKRKLYRDEQLNLLMNSLADSKKFWSLLKSEKIVECDIQANSWFNYFRDLFLQCSNTANHALIPSHAEIPSVPCEILDRLYDRTEICNALQKMKSNKAVGIDGIPAEIWKHGNIEDILVTLFNNLGITGCVPDEWKTAVIVPIYKKGDRGDPGNYRGISLLATLSKVYSGVLNQRLLKWAKETDFFTDAQNGFRPGRSTIDSIFTLHTAVTSQFRRNKIIYCAYVDFWKCFDSITRELLFHKLRKFGISQAFVEKLECIYHDIKAKIRCNNRMTESFPCPAGLRQGCVTSSSLFMCYLNELEEFFAQHDVNFIPLADKELIVMMFADDLAIVDTTVKGLQRKLNLLAQYCREWGLTVNTEKTKIMAFRGGGRMRANEVWNYNGTLIENVNKFEYLGLLLSNSNSLTPTINDRIVKTKKAMGVVFAHLKKYGNIPIHVMLKILDTKIIPVMTHGSEIWGLDDLTKAEATINRFYRILLRVPYNTSIDFVRGELGRHSLKPIILKSVVKYWVKLLNSKPGTAIAEAYRTQYLLAENETECWGLKLKNLLCKMGFAYAWINQNNLNGTMFISEFYNRCKDCDYQSWHANVNNYGALRTYRKFKDDLTMEPYVCLNLPRKARSMFTKLRGGMLRIESNLGRWAVPYRLYINRLCPLCNSQQVEDEAHVIFSCPVWRCYRQQLMKYECFRNSSIKQLCTTRNTDLISDISKFLNLVLFERSEILDVL